MAERRRGLAYALIATSLLLAAGCWFDIGSAGVLAWLAQAPMALGIALLRGTQRGARLGRDAFALMMAWAVGFALSAGLLAVILTTWPLSVLRSVPNLMAVLAMGSVGAALLLALWRYWPLWHGLEREGGGIGKQLAAMDSHQRGAWSGLQVAVPVWLLLAAGVALGWPGLLAGDARTIAVVAYALLLPLAHALLQTAPTRSLMHGLPVRDMHEDDDAEAADDAQAVEPVPAAVPGTAVDVEALTRDLYAAARLGRVERALQLLDAGADAKAEAPAGERDRRGLSVLAAVLPDLRLLRGLIERGVDLNPAQGGMAPLLAATRDSWHGRPEAVMTLLANGADARVRDADGNTPLHHAARSSDPGVAALLRDAGAEMDALNGEGVSPLGIACAAGNWRLARFLLERNARTEPAGGQPVLLAAAGTEEDDPAGVQLLLRHKARVDARDGRGRCALHEAAFAGHADICSALLDAGADVHARDGLGRTPLLDSARAAALPVLEVLVAAGADAAACDGAAANALHLACTAEAPSSALVQRLLELGVDPQAADAEGRTPTDLAATAGRWTLVNALDPSRALPVSMDDDDGALPDRPPQLLLRERMLDAAEPHELTPLAALLGTAELNGLLVDADLATQPSRVEWLLRHGAQAEARVPGALLPVAAAMSRGGQGIDTLRVLFAYGASPAGGGNLARYMAACLDGGSNTAAESFALDLLDRGADPYAGSPDGDPPVALAVRLHWPRVLQRLIAHGVDLDARDSHGMSALHVAAALASEHELKLLIAAGAAPDRRAADGQTPLGVALAAGRRDLADWLDWRGWRLPQRALQASDVPAAAIVGDADAVRRLLDIGMPVNAVDSQGCSALLRAAGGGHRELVELLLARGADPGLAANTGATPLSAAVSMRQAEIVDRLLEAGAGLEQRLPGEVTVLMLAAALGLPELVERLMQAGADLHASDAQGLTPLHCAALYGFTARERPRLLALLDSLLLAGADPQKVATGGATPLLLLLGSRAEAGTPTTEEVLLAGVERLFDEDVRLDARDQRGFGPLHLAALHGLLRVANALLRQGADLNQRDTLNRTPREVALMRGYVDVAAELAPADGSTPNVSMARFLRE